ncbi:uncharacterized protein PAC_06756 [Phialocephala subalpina]|uniref:Zn(2)-C6 fungal-type domain-containing protein n=1 Tax=Phialocephala subalpina TaxID=576137 RepID=A0A1L7WVR5_9HELO|nr:uncharacterized protein PAC_06756 [Phialocephala subalpina]
MENNQQQVCEHDYHPTQIKQQQSLGRPQSRPAHGRKRASIACLSCRKRKVRCDVARGQGPCTNCRLDKASCVMTKSNILFRASEIDPASRRSRSPALVADKAVHRRRPPPGGRTISTTFLNPITPIATATEMTSQPQVWEFGRSASILAGSPVWDEAVQHNPFLTWDYHNSRVEKSQINDTAPYTEFDWCRDPGFVRFPERESQATSIPSMVHSMTNNEALLTSDVDGSKAFSMSEYHDTNTNQTSNQDYETWEMPNGNVPSSNYRFLKVGETTTLSSNDWKFLEYNGCLSVPGSAVLDDFMKQYFLYVHPNQPILDEEAFWSLSTGHDQGPVGTEWISLFVLQAMLMVSSSYVSVGTLHRIGLANARQAASIFYHRAKLLFDFGCYADTLSAAQGSLILSQHLSNDGDRRFNTIWIERAFCHGKSSGILHYNTSRVTTRSSKKALKRLLWCSILRDRILALGTRRPLLIVPDYFESDLEPFTAEDLDDEIGHSRVYDAATKRLLVNLFVKQCQLATPLTDVIMVISPLNESLDPGYMSENNFSKTVAKIVKCRQLLCQWYDNAVISFPTPAGLKDSHESVTLFTNLMYIYYHSAWLALGHREVLLFEARSAAWHRAEFLHKKRRQLEESISAITEIVKELVQLNLTIYLPFTVVPYTALPLLLLSLDVYLAPSDTLTAMRQRRLDIFLEAMKTQQPRYDGAAKITNAIKRTLACLGFSKPVRCNDAQNITSVQENQFCTSYSRTSLNPAKDWGDVFLSQPGFYLRLILTLDLSFSRGRLPYNTDFPITLQSIRKIEDAVRVRELPPTKPTTEGFVDSEIFEKENETYDEYDHSSHPGIPPVPTTYELFNETPSDQLLHMQTADEISYEKTAMDYIAFDTSTLDDFIAHLDPCFN